MDWFLTQVCALNTCRLNKLENRQASTKFSVFPLSNHPPPSIPTLDKYGVNGCWTKVCALDSLKFFKKKKKGLKPALQFNATKVSYVLKVNLIFTKSYFKHALLLPVIFATGSVLQLFAYDTVMNNLTPKSGEQPIVPIPASLVAGAVAGVSSTLCTYPLELIKTRLTIQVNLNHKYHSISVFILIFPSSVWSPFCL